MATANTQPTKAPRLSPHLVVAGAAEAIEFYKKAFGATEVMRLPGNNGKLMHAAVTINGEMVMLMDEAPEWGARGPKSLGGSSVTFNLASDNADASLKRAVDAGARLVMPAQDMFWGDRYGVIEDPFGHSWAFAQPLRDTPMSEAELKEAAKEMSGA